MNRRALVAAVLVLLVGCGSSGPTTGSGTRTQAADSPTSSTSLPTAAAATTTTRKPGSTTFADPSGSYTMEIGSGWLDSSGAITGVTSWTVATATASGAPNVTLIVQPGAAQPLTASMDSALADPKKVLPDFAVLTQKITKGAKGQDIGLLEYTGFGYHFLAVVIESRAGAVVATFTVALDRFDALRAEVEPYLLTLQAA